MNVLELISALKELPGNAEVVVFNEDYTPHAIDLVHDKLEGGEAHIVIKEAGE